MIEQIIKNVSKSLTTIVEAKFLEAFLIWGVDVNNHEEILKRSKVVSDGLNDRYELYIDNSLVMIFKQPKILTGECIEDSKFNIEFECSEINKPL